MHNLCVSKDKTLLVTVVSPHSGTDSQLEAAATAVGAAAARAEDRKQTHYDGILHADYTALPAAFESYGAWGQRFRTHFAELPVCRLVQEFDLASVDHEYAAAFRGVVHSHLLMPRHQQDAITRGAFARFWQHRIATTIQVGNARMFDQWLRAQQAAGTVDGGSATPCAPPRLPEDLAELIREWTDDTDYEY